MHPNLLHCLGQLDGFYTHIARTGPRILTLLEGASTPHQPTGYLAYYWISDGLYALRTEITFSLTKAVGLNRALDSATVTGQELVYTTLTARRCICLRVQFHPGRTHIVHPKTTCIDTCLHFLRDWVGIKDGAQLIFRHLVAHHEIGLGGKHPLTHLATEFRIASHHSSCVVFYFRDNSEVPSNDTIRDGDARSFKEALSYILDNQFHITRVKTLPPLTGEERRFFYSLAIHA